jgi:hypothetical protein
VPAVPAVHRRCDPDLDHADDGLQTRIPERDVQRCDAQQLEAEEREAQNAGCKSDQDQPEEPAPAVHDTNRQQDQEAGDSDQECQPSLDVAGEAERLELSIVDVWSGDQDHHQCYPAASGESQQHELGPIHGCALPPKQPDSARSTQSRYARVAAKSPSIRPSLDRVA